MNIEETFKIRAYSFCELAHLYFPNIAKASASKQLRRWIKGNDDLILKLKNSGHKSGNKILTPIHVEFILEVFGLP